MSPQGILDRVRAEGYADGLSQAQQVCYDDAYEKGRRDALGEFSGIRFRWFLFGFGVMHVCWMLLG